VCASRKRNADTDVPFKSVRFQIMYFPPFAEVFDNPLNPLSATTPMVTHGTFESVSAWASAGMRSMGRYLWGEDGRGTERNREEQ
jgi:hypothetical protein